MFQEVFYVSIGGFLTLRRTSLANSFDLSLHTYFDFGAFQIFGWDWIVHLVDTWWVQLHSILYSLCNSGAQDSIKTGKGGCCNFGTNWTFWNAILRSITQFFSIFSSLCSSWAALSVFAKTNARKTKLKIAALVEISPRWVPKNLENVRLQRDKTHQIEARFWNRGQVRVHPNISYRCSLRPVT